MTFDSQTMTPASSITGTMPTGLSALNSGSEVERKPPAQSSRWKVSPSSSQTQSTLRTLMDAAYP